MKTSVDALFYDLKPDEQKILPNKRNLWKKQVYLSGLRLTDGEFLVVATDWAILEPILTYGKRWETEY